MNYLNKKIELNNEQKEMFNLMENTNRNLFITGKAGTGKSFLLKYFKEHTKKSVLYTAPTGIAAINIGAVTLHSIFGFDNLKDGRTFIRLSERQMSTLKHFEVLVIDEVSMVRVDVLQQVDMILKRLNDKDKPFGGKQVIVFGDVFQLPPVVKEKAEIKCFNDKYGGIYFFNSPAYKEGNFEIKELGFIHRQNDTTFIDILNNIRVGKLPQEQERILNQHYVFKTPNNIVQLVPKKELARKINNYNLKLINRNEYNYSASITYNDTLRYVKKVDQKDYMCDFNLKLKVGALVMMIANDNEQKRWVNGTFGRVSELGNNYIKVIINNKEYTVEKVDFIKYRCYYNQEEKKLTYIEESCVSQYPLILAYAITIHKSQGLTYEEVICNLKDCFESGQAYVALSRCANFEKLYLVHRIELNIILVNDAVMDFYNQQIRPAV